MWWWLCCSIFNEEMSCLQWGWYSSYMWLKNLWQLLWNCAKFEATTGNCLMELWHQKFGRANHRQLSKISKLEAVIGLLKFGKFQKTICGLGQMGNKRGILISKWIKLWPNDPWNSYMLISWVQSEPKTWVETNTSWLLSMISLDTYG